MTTTVTSIPAEWSDPREALPHVTAQLRAWLVRMRRHEAESLILSRALARPEHVDLDQARCMADGLHARAEALNHEVGNRLAAWLLISDELKRAGDQHHG